MVPVHSHTVKHYVCQGPQGGQEGKQFPEKIKNHFMARVCWNCQLILVMQRLAGFNSQTRTDSGLVLVYYKLYQGGRLRHAIIFNNKLEGLVESL
jgi:hypothetical protein